MKLKIFSAIDCAEIILRGRLIVEIYSLLLNLYYLFSPYIKIGSRTFLSAGISLNVRYGGKIIIGKKCHIQKGAQLITYGGNIIIGNRVSINPYTLLYGQGDLHIGNDVRIAGHCMIVPSNHNYSDINRPIIEQGLSCKGIVIEDDVWIGGGVKILDGVKIGKGCVIGAGSVVTNSTEEYGIYVGIPAKKINSRTLNTLSFRV